MKLPSKFYRISIVTLFLLNACFSKGVKAEDCTEFFRSSRANLSNVKESVTEGLISYLALLLERRAIGAQELRHLIQSLKSGQLIAIQESDAVLNSELYEHYKGIQEYAAFGGLDRELISKWAEEKLEHTQEVRDERSLVREETEEIHQMMEFVTISLGKFLKKQADKENEVAIEVPFEILSTPLTQLQWALVMRENPSEFSDGESSITLSISGKTIQLQPDHPVENVSFFDIEGYYLSEDGATRLRKKDYLLFQEQILSRKEKYIYREGFLDRLNHLANENDPLIYQLIPDHEPGLFYRLPSEVEWEYVASGEGRVNSKWHFGDNLMELEDYAWVSTGRSNKEGTQAVSLKKPLIINGGEIYDLHGNVWEWVTGGLEDVNSNEVPESIRNVLYSEAHLKGGSWSSDFSSKRTSRFHRKQGTLHEPSSKHGFRLVRVREKKKAPGNEGLSKP